MIYMAKIVFLRKEIAAMKNAGGAWGPESVGIFGIAVPGTMRHEVYSAFDGVKDVVGSVASSAADAGTAAFSFGSFFKDNWKLLSIGAVALVVLLKD